MTERWGDDPKLRALLGDQGAAGFRALFDGFPELVGILWAIRDDAGRVVDFAFGYGNAAMLRAFRITAATAQRYTLLEALPPMRDSRALAAYVRTCDEGVPWFKEVTYDTPFGDGYMLGTFAHRTAKLGDGVMVFLTDVTDQRRMEAELSSYADVVAHDLREPIANMALLVRLLEQRADQPPSVEVLELLRSGIDRSQELIEAILGYARLGELRCEPVALDALVAGVAEDLGPQLSEAELAVGELPEVEADPRQLRRVFQNLIGNAVKFRGEAPLQVQVGAERRPEEWVLTVSDNGVGVDHEQARRIFGMFARGDDEGEADGLGIGLAVCRRIVEAHGGHIWVEPGTGGGSAFRFTLPAADPP